MRRCRAVLMAVVVAAGAGYGPPSAAVGADLPAGAEPGPRAEPRSGTELTPGAALVAGGLPGHASAREEDEPGDAHEPADAHKPDSRAQEETSRRADTAALTPRVPPDSLPSDGPRRAGEDEELEAEVRRVASSLRCPVCLNLSIEDSPSQLARDMKDMIRRRLQRGDTPAEIRRYFVDRYGEWVLISPEPEGINLLLWILPAVGLAGGGILVAVVVRRWTGRDGETAAQPE